MIKPGIVQRRRFYRHVVIPSTVMPTEQCWGSQLPDEDMPALVPSLLK